MFRQGERAWLVVRTNDKDADDSKQHEEEELPVDKCLGLDDVHSGVEKRVGVVGRGAIEHRKGKDKLPWGELVGRVKCVLKGGFSAWCQLQVVCLTIVNVMHACFGGARHTSYHKRKVLHVKVKVKGGVDGPANGRYIDSISSTVANAKNEWCLWWVTGWVHALLLLL